MTKEETKEYNKKYYQENKERMKEVNKKYYQKNREKIHRGAREWCENNQDRNRELKRNWNKNNPDKIKRYVEENKEKHDKYQKEYREENREKSKEYMENYYKENKKTLSEKDKKYRELNKELIKERRKQYFQKNKERIRLKMKEKRQTEEWKEWKEKHDLDRVHIISWRDMLRSAIRRMGLSKNEKTIDLLGYSADQLKTYLESLFLDGMSWGNKKLWSIDHIIPLSSFRTDAPMYIVNSLENLQPLWSKDNSVKSNKMEDTEKSKRLIIQFQDYLK